MYLIESRLLEVLLLGLSHHRVFHSQSVHVFWNLYSKGGLTGFNKGNKNEISGQCKSERYGIDVPSVT